jgi:hypothetical protein
MKKSYLYGILSVGWELKKKKKKINEKGLLRKPKIEI